MRGNTAGNSVYNHTKQSCKNTRSPQMTRLPAFVLCGSRRLAAGGTSVYAGQSAARSGLSPFVAVCAEDKKPPGRNVRQPRTFATEAPYIPKRATRSLAGKVAIVTGAGSAGDGIGNGRASSILLAEAGASVVCVDMHEQNAAHTVKMIEQEGHGRGISLFGDVTKEADCKATIAAAIKAFGRLDILVNNVGIIGAKGTAVDVDLDEWAKSMELNVTSYVLMARHAIPEMVKNEGQQYKGAIVLMGSVAGLRGGTNNLLYPTSKGAVVNMTRAMASNHAAQGIRVNCVCPGMLYTPMVYESGMSEKLRALRLGRSMLKTEGNGWDTGAAVRFLASDEARWMTGSVMTVDAGATAMVPIDLE